MIRLEPLIVTWQDFVEIADGPNKGPRRELALRLYRVLHVDAMQWELECIPLQPLPGTDRSFAFSLASLQDLILDKRRFAAFKRNRNVGEAGGTFMVELLAHCLPLCMKCVQLSRVAENVFVCESCGLVIEQNDGHA